MKLVFGLGNPEEKYHTTRHNVGFYLVDAYAGKQKAEFQAKGKFRAEIAECAVTGEKVLLAKPTTYYNLVGESMRAIMDFYKIEPADILVVHDDLALPFGMVRTRVGGSGGGNNGIKSVNQHGGEATNRLRVGIANDQRSMYGDVDFVLGKFSSDEQKALESSISDKAMELVDKFITGAHEPTSHTISRH